MTRLTFCLLFSSAKLSSQIYFFLIAHINFSLLGFLTKFCVASITEVSFFFPQVFDSVIKKKVGVAKAMELGFTGNCFKLLSLLEPSLNPGSQK